MKIDSLCSRLVLGAMLSALLPGCVAGEAGEGAEDVGAAASEIGFGTVEPNWEFPWVVHLSGCHGVLVHDRWVLTAAHCVDTKFNGVTVSFTRTDPTTGEVFTGSQQTGVGSVFVHPSWDPFTVRNDIALVKMPSAFPPNPMLRRAELPLHAPVAGLEGTVASTVHHTGAIPAGSVAVLRGPMSSVGSTLFSVQSPSASVCPGDSGSGFITKAGGMNFVAGIASTGSSVETCEIKPGNILDLTRVDVHVDWIRSTIGLNPGAFRPAPADYDGDGKVDVAGVFATGDWRIDLAANGFGAWDLTYPGYGGSTATPVPADYDGDGKADLAVKNTGGAWNINFSADGLASGFNLFLDGYGPSTSLPLPADYDGDGKADLAIKSSGGEWMIDFASDGFGGWNNIYYGYGGSTARPVPGDYDGDGKADLAIKNSGGEWMIDFASDGFGGWNNIYYGYGGTSAVPVTADYDGDGKSDLSVRDGTGAWYRDYASDGFGGWNDIRDGYGTGGALVPRDYDGDKRADLAIVGNGWWYIDYGSSPQDGWNVVMPIAY